MRFGSSEPKLVAVAYLLGFFVCFVYCDSVPPSQNLLPLVTWSPAWFLCLFCLLRFGSSDPKLVVIVDIFAAIVHATLLLLAFVAVVVDVVVDVVVGGTTTTSTVMVKMIAGFDFALVDKEPSKGILQEQSNRTSRGTSSTHQIQAFAGGFGTSVLPMVVLFCHDVLVLSSSTSRDVMVVQRLVVGVGTNTTTSTTAAARGILAVAIGVVTGRFERAVVERNRVSFVPLLLLLLLLILSLLLLLILVVLLDIAAAGIATEDIVVEDDSSSSSHRRSCYY